MGVIVQNPCYSGFTKTLTLDGRLQEYNSLKELIRQLPFGIQGDLVNQKDWLFQRTLTTSSPSAVFPTDATRQFVTATAATSALESTPNLLQPNFILILTDSPIAVTFGYNAVVDLWPSAGAVALEYINSLSLTANTVLCGMTWPVATDLLAPTYDNSGTWTNPAGSTYRFTPTVTPSPAWLASYYIGQKAYCTWTSAGGPQTGVLTVTANAVDSFDVTISSDPPNLPGSPSGTAFLFYNPGFTVNAHAGKVFRRVLSTVPEGDFYITSNTADTLTLEYTTAFTPITSMFGTVSSYAAFRDPMDNTKILNPQPANQNFSLVVNGYFIHDMAKGATSLAIAPNTPTLLVNWPQGVSNGNITSAWAGVSDATPTFPIQVTKMSGVTNAKVLVYAAMLNLT